MVYKIVLFGAPGAGKGTQAKKLAEKYGLKHISTGEIFRRHRDEGTEIGKEISEIINQGNLVNDELTFKLVKLELEELEEGYILDGFPRTLPQSEMLDNYDKITHRFNIDISEETVLERIVNRRSCSKQDCGKIYHLRFNPPKEKGLCDNCGSNLLQRPDDTEEAVKERLKEYNEKTKPLLDYYKDRMIDIDGDKSIEEVFSDICEKLQ